MGVDPVSSGIRACQTDPNPANRAPKPPRCYHIRLDRQKEAIVLRSEIQQVQRESVRLLAQIARARRPEITFAEQIAPVRLLAFGNAHRKAFAVIAHIYMAE
jgi:hypothetical protein